MSHDKSYHSFWIIFNSRTMTDNLMQFQQSLWRLLGIILFNILGSCLGFIILAFASRNMSLQEFGLLGVFTALLYVPGLIANIVQISGMEVVSTSSRNYGASTFKNLNRRRVASHFFFSILISGVVAAYLRLNPSNLDAALIEKATLIFLCFVTVFSSLFQGRYLSSGRFTEFHAVGFLISIIRTIITIVLLESGNGLVAFLMIYAASTGLVGIFCTIKSRHVYWLQPKQFSRKFFIQAITIGFTAFCFQLDVILSTGQISQNDTGVYFAAAQLAKFTCLLVLSASLAFLPSIMNNTARIFDREAILRRGNKFSFSVSVILSLALLLIGSEFIKLLFGPDFTSSTRVIPYFILGSIAWSILLTNINLNISDENYRIIAMLFLLIVLQFTLVSISNSMQTIALSWSITGTVGLGLYKLFSRHNWFHGKNL